MAQGGVLVATASAMFDYEGQRVILAEGVTTVREGHPILEGRERLFKPLVPTFEVQEPAKPARGKAAGSAADG